MRSLRDAARLLADASSVDALAPITGALGFDSASPLSTTLRDELGIPSELHDVRLARGPGSLRALLCHTGSSDLDDDRALRTHLQRLAATLGARAPRPLWLAFVVQPRAGSSLSSSPSPHHARLTIAGWSAAHHPPRVAALVVDRTRIVPSDAETLRALAAKPHDSDLLTHARWLDLLGRESLTRRFFRTLERTVELLANAAIGSAPSEERRELALLAVSRLIFLSFLQTKGWLDDDRAFLTRTFADCMASGGDYHRRVLLPLWFGTLNTRPAGRAPTARAFGRVPFLNGGLFAPTPLERRRRTLRFGDAELGNVFGDLLDRYRFTAREDAQSWSEAAVDPEMLGRAFESLMAADDRRRSGAFYTPPRLVTQLTRSALADRISRVGLSAFAVEAALDGNVDPRDAPAIRECIQSMRVLDPACGSGAFLVHALESLADLARAAGDRHSIAAIRRSLVARVIFGVDVNPTAVWLCELRLWLSVVIESRERDPLRVLALPNLDHQVRVGDALAGGDFASSPRDGAGRRIADLRERYASAFGARKVTLAARLDRLEREQALHALDRERAAASHARTELILSLRGRDLFGAHQRPTADERRALDVLRARARELQRRRRALLDGGALPFTFAAHFADVAAAGGFDALIGNPPWVRPHHLPPAQREALRRTFVVCRDSAWRAGAQRAAAGRGFGGQADLAAPFVERSLSLLRDRGTLALLLPAKLWRALAGGGLRALLARDARITHIDDWSDAPALFDAATYPSLVVAQRLRHALAPAAESCPPMRKERDTPTDRGIAVAVHRHHGDPRRFHVARSRLSFDDDPSSPWLLLPRDVRAAFESLRSSGPALGDASLTRPTLGVKCGRNEAFLVHIVGGDGALSHVTAADRSGTIESSLLRPLLRGQSLGASHAAHDDGAIIWPYDASGAPLRTLPPHAARWLAPWRRELAARSDARGGRAPWWSLFRTDAARADSARVVWADLAREPRPIVLPVGDPHVPLNSCYVARCARDDDALALAALISSPLAAAWLACVAEPARGGFLRFLAWTVALLPLPHADRWIDARPLLAPFARSFGAPPPDPESLLEAVLEAHGLSRRQIAPLLDWHHGA